MPGLLVILLVLREGFARTNHIARFFGRLQGFSSQSQALTVCNVLGRSATHYYIVLSV